MSKDKSPAAKDDTKTTTEEKQTETPENKEDKKTTETSTEETISREEYAELQQQKQEADKKLAALEKKESERLAQEEEKRQQKLEEDGELETLNNELKAKVKEQDGLIAELTKSNETMQGMFNTMLTERVESLTTDMDTETKTSFMNLLNKGQTTEEKFALLPDLEKAFTRQIASKADPSNGIQQQSGQSPFHGSFAERRKYVASQA